MTVTFLTLYLEQSTMIYYHGTSAAALPAILKDGLVPHAGKGGAAWASEHNFASLSREAIDDDMPILEKSVYLTTSLAWAKAFGVIAADINKSEPRVLSVTLPKFLEKKVRIDERFTSSIFSPDYGKGLRFVGTIPPKYIDPVDVATFSDTQGLLKANHLIA
jgi:hypothetical protein